MENKKNALKKKNRIKVYIPLILITILVVGGLGYWYREYNKYLTTDDAHVDSDNVAISSKILGRIVHLYADEGDSIKEGALMAELDSTDLIAQKNQFIALREQSIASQTQTVAKYQYDEESINVQKIALAKAQDDFSRARKQFAGGVITREQFDHIQKGYETAKVQLTTAQKQVAVSKAAIESARTAVKSAQKQIGITTSQLKNTKLYAPSNGIVAKRWLLPGDVTQPGQSILTISNNRKVWVSVFLWSHPSKSAGSLYG
jgi:membrane fusion protein (multidrug efflux system)